MTLRLDDIQHQALRERAATDGVSMQEVAQRAIRDYLTRQDHRDRVAVAADRILTVHAEAIERLGR